MRSHTLRVSVAMIVAAMTAVGNAADVKEDPKTPMLSDMISRAEATQIADVALKECAARGLPASVVVADAAGHLRAAFSDDNAKLVGLGSSSAKVRTVAAFQMSTGTLQARVKSDKEFADKYANDKRYLFSAGGLPIYKNGKFVAIIAVGGAHSIDEQCALAAIKTLSWASVNSTSSTEYKK